MPKPPNRRFRKLGMPHLLLPPLLALAAIPSLLAAQAATRPADSTIVRGDRTIYHEHGPS